MTAPKKKMTTAPPKRGRPAGDGPSKKAHTTYLSAAAEDWILNNVPRSISTSKFISAAVDHFIKSGAAAKLTVGK